MQIRIHVYEDKKLVAVIKCYNNCIRLVVYSLFVCTPGTVSCTTQCARISSSHILYTLSTINVLSLNVSFLVVCEELLHPRISCPIRPATSRRSGYFATTRCSEERSSAEQTVIDRYVLLFTRLTDRRHSCILIG